MALIVAVGLAGLIALVLTLASGRTVRLWLLAGLFFSSIAVQIDVQDNVLPTLLFPIQRRRTEFVAAIGVLTLLSFLIYGVRSSGLRTSAQTLALLVVGAYAGLLRIKHEGFNEGGLTILFAVVIIPTITAATIGYVRSRDDLFRLLRTLAMGGIVWTGFVALQFVANRSYVTLGNSNRFMGLLSNPQHAGAFVASIGVITVWLAVYDPARVLRPLWIATTGAMVIMILWSGSRTGIGMFTVGVVASMYSRFGLFILLLPVLAVVLYAGIRIAESLGIGLNTGRLASTENTRQVVWQNMLQSGLSNPLYGVGTDNAGGSENGYLYGFAAFGVGMLALTILMTLVSMYTSWRLFTLRRNVDRSWKPLVDLMLAYIALYYAGGLFEGYFMARVATNHFLMMVFAGAIVRVFDFATQGEDVREFGEGAAPAVEQGQPKDFGTGYSGDYTAPA
ncbi:MAG: hypothetical protein AAF108_03860 [Planctomycetota bacterium]